MLTPRVRRTVAAATGAILLGGTLAACSSDSGDDGKTVIEYGWWGSGASDEATVAAIEAFEAENPDIDVEGEATPWDGYWDKLATMSAGKDAPDVIHMSERYIREYGERGALADLSSLEDIDLSTLDESMLALGEVGDAIYAVPAGVNTFTVAINEDLFEAAGVPIPDDSTWTWDELAEASAATASGDVVGMNYRPGIENLQPWLHQQGQTMYNEEGTGVGFERDALVSYLENILLQQENGGPTADQVSEEMGMPLESTLFGTGKQSMTWIYTSEMPAFAEASGSNLRLMRVPSEAGAAEENGMYLRGSSFYSISANADDAEQKAAAKFVDFMVNNEDALSELGMLRGVPPNADLVDVIREDLTPDDAEVLEFVDGIRPELTVDSPTPSPQGSGNVQGIFDREVLELLYDRADVEETADSIMQAIDDELG